MLQNSDMFKKIKSIFVVEDVINKEQTKNNEDAQDKLESAFNPSTTSVNINASSSVNNDAKPDVKFTDLLLKAIESNNMEGFDYLEFKNSLKSIEAVIPDESMRYKSAFEMAKTMGLTKEKLIQSAQHYVNILASEDKKFKDALSNQKAKQIQSRADQLASIEKSIIDKQKMIENLSKEIETSKSQLEAVRTEINEAVVKIDTTNQQFVASYNLVFGQIDEDIQKINKNI
jgi:hypothetical protein